ncbi:MAG TPA: UDP-N-acetylmuramoyl-L-alanine--D-glutamate ligase [Candidatus Saccharimonadales bacterium]|nr:UDP-N-acetylmuramoyl-L-alanine--D-glutamate ligase [Candidatus Saccharimonadales bacterium]
MKVAIVGWGLEGQSAFNYFGPEHEYLIASEEPRADLPAPSDKIEIQSLVGQRPVGITSQAEDLSYLAGIENCDKIIYSVTSVKNLEKLFGPEHKFWKKAVTTQHIFFETVKTKNIIGVTGSKGKGTTSTLIAKMLEAAGKKVFLGGNIGVPVLDFVNGVQPEDWVVLELSSFQLYKLNYSPHIAVCLMITEEHLDWHANIEDYVKAKSNLFRYQAKDDIAIYMADNLYAQRIAGCSPGIKIPYFDSPGAYVRADGMIVMGQPETEIIKTGQLKLIGRHNWQNVCAALTAASQVSDNLEAMRQVLASFSGLEHRLEFVRSVGGVDYYDDSFGTTPDTAIVAIQSFVQPVVLIAGGHDKGLSFEKLVEEIVGKDRVRHVIAIGQTGPVIAGLLKNRGFSSVTEGLSKMPEIVAEARRTARRGDAVILSCGTSSFGLFTDYKDRGNQFKKAVQELS